MSELPRYHWHQDDEVYGVMEGPTPDGEWVKWADVSAALVLAAPSKPLEMTDEEIKHLWDTHINQPTPKYPLIDADKIAFARAVLAAQGHKDAHGEGVGGLGDA